MTVKRTIKLKGNGACKQCRHAGNPDKIVFHLTLLKTSVLRRYWVKICSLVKQSNSKVILMSLDFHHQNQ